MFIAGRFRRRRFFYLARVPAAVSRRRVRFTRWTRCANMARWRAPFWRQNVFAAAIRGADMELTRCRKRNSEFRSQKSEFNFMDKTGIIVVSICALLLGWWFIEQ